MKHILSRHHVDVLAPLASSRVLLAFDFDGTLAPIVANRHRAAMRARTRALLAAACQLYPCAVISGRARGDVATRLVDVGAKYVVGNHGIEAEFLRASKFERAVATVRPMLERALAAVSGLDIEDKRYSLSIHYRRARNKRVARAAIDAAVSSLPRRMRVVPGKLVANVIPDGARNKGDILLDLHAREAADIALYVGDDVTDEDVFTLRTPSQLLAMRVGRTTMSAAKFYLRDQGEIDSLLARLVQLRQRRKDR